MGSKHSGFNVTDVDWNDFSPEIFLRSKSIALGIFSPDGQLISSNPAMDFFLDPDPETGLPRNSFVNPDFETLAGKKGEGEIFNSLLTIGNFSNSSYVLISKIFRKDGKLFVFAETDAADLFEENKKMSRLNQEVNNLQRQLIKEKMNLQQTLKELKETQQMLVHSEKMNALGKLVAGVAHEINNPVSFVYSNIFSLEQYIGEIIQAYTELEDWAGHEVDSGKLDQMKEIREKNDLDFLFDDISDVTKQSKVGLERVKTIVEDLRKFSRLDEAEMKQIDLIDNIRSTMGIAGIEFSSRNIQVQLLAPETLTVECFPGQLNQAILNVLINAAQSIDASGEISVSVEEIEPNIRISVQDNGCGMPEVIQKKIFDPFFTTKPVGSGTGLGLSITYKIITDLHKGSIEVESVKGKGSIFKLLIPKNQER